MDSMNSFLWTLMREASSREIKVCIRNKKRIGDLDFLGAHKPVCIPRTKNNKFHEVILKGVIGWIRVQEHWFDSLGHCDQGSCNIPYMLQTISRSDFL